MHLPARRIFTEHRRVALPVLIALAVNVVVFTAVVYPFRARVRATEARAEAAAQQQAAAQRDDAAARGVAEGRDRTDAALKTFYGSVLPGNLAQARQATFLRLSQLAGKHNLQRSQRGFGIETERGSSLQRLRISMSLQGEYDDIRQFIHEVESGTDFIVIDSVSLRQGVEAGAPLTLDLVLSTYYRMPANGA